MSKITKIRGIEVIKVNQYQLIREIYAAEGLSPREIVIMANLLPYALTSSFFGGYSDARSG